MAGGGEIVPVSPRARQPSRGGRRRLKATACLPLDIIVEIASRSDAATLVRCAATCKGARRRIAEDAKQRGRLRLRDTGRFLLPLLHGHLTAVRTFEGTRGRTSVYLMDTTTAAHATRLVVATFASDAAEAETLTDAVPVESRGGLFLVRATATRWHDSLLVCNPATGRRQVLPPEPEQFSNGGDSRNWYVLLVGDRDDGTGVSAGAGASVGRPFHVLKAKLVFSKSYPSYRRLIVQTFSSEHGAWSPLMEIPTPNIHGSYLFGNDLPKALVVGDAVHWLCQTDARSYVLMLDVRTAQVNETALPPSFHRFGVRRSYLLATASAGGNPVVLVADNDKISAWEQLKHTKMWKPQPQVVIENKVILRFKNVGPTTERTTCVPELLSFGERSGALLLRMPGYGLLWLDLHSKKIVRCFSDHWISSYELAYCPYEVDLSSWVPTFSSVITTI